MHLNYRKLGVLKNCRPGQYQHGLAGVHFHRILDRRPESLYPLVISCDLVSTPLITDFTEDRENWSGEAGEGSQIRAASY